MEMKIDKITHKNNQAWITIRAISDNTYLGMLHIVNPDLVKIVREENPSNIIIK